MKALLLSLLLASFADAARPRSSKFIEGYLREYPNASPVAPAETRREYFKRLADAAFEQTKTRVVYDPAYVKLAYPGGDVAPDKGVCTDVLIRAYRRLGVDLQVQVHEDMKSSFALYPALWGRRAPDANIDHRRVPNLMVYFKRHGQVLPLSDEAADYHPGDVVAWDLGGGVTHIGLVADRRGPEGRPLIVHNIGAGPQLEDVLFNWTRIGHFRYPR